MNFVRKDVMIDEQAGKESLNLGVRSIPALVVDREVAIGFDRARIDALLNL